MAGCSLLSPPGPGRAVSGCWRSASLKGRPPDLEQALHDSPDDVVGSTGPGRDTDGEPPFRQPAAGRHDRARLRVAEADRLGRQKPRLVLNMIRGRELRAQLGEVARVRAVEA